MDGESYYLNNLEDEGEDGFAPIDIILGSLAAGGEVMMVLPDRMFDEDDRQLIAELRDVGVDVIVPVDN